MNPIKYILTIALLSLITSCDLEVREPFEYVNELPETATFTDQTVWEFIQEQRTLDDTDPNNDLDGFDILIEAINYTGLQDIYQQNAQQYTYILMKNESWRDQNGIGIIKDLTKSETASITEADVETVRNILLYHIVDEYVDQSGDKLKVLDTHYRFNTLLPGDFGFMTISRDDRIRLNLNYDPNLPTSRRRSLVTNHNYTFKNGIAHFIIKDLRIVEF